MSTYGIDIEKVADLQELAKKLEQLPREELLYIAGRADAYVAMQRENAQKPA